MENSSMAAKRRHILTALPPPVKGRDRTPSSGSAAPPPIPAVGPRLRIDDNGNFIDARGRFADKHVTRPADRSRSVDIPRDETHCARCHRAWHIGAVREGEDAKTITFVQLVKMAEGVFVKPTLRTYSRKDRGAGKFFDCMRVVGNKRLYDGCPSMNVIDRQLGIDTTIHEQAIAEYDRACPTRRRVASIEQQLARDFDEIAALERDEFSDAWMRRWRSVNEQLERIVKWIDDINHRHGLRKPGGLFFTNRFRSRKKMIRSLFPELPDETFENLWRAFRQFLRYERRHYLTRFVTDGSDA
jgi:hypothetical protein